MYNFSAEQHKILAQNRKIAHISMQIDLQSTNTSPENSFTQSKNQVCNELKTPIYISQLKNLHLIQQIILFLPMKYIHCGFPDSHQDTAFANSKVYFTKA